MITLGAGHPDDITGYIGPGDLYRRFMRGQTVTREDALTDQSEWIIVPEWQIGAANRRDCDCDPTAHHRWNCSSTPIWAQTIRDLDTNPWTVVQNAMRGFEAD